jgi:Na+/H+-dicarboxylate symporter
VFKLRKYFIYEEKLFQVWFRQNLFPVLIIISALSGLGFGFLLKSIWEINPLVITYIGLPGKLVIRAFMMILVPLIVASLANSMSKKLFQI